MSSAICFNLDQSKILSSGNAKSWSAGLQKTPILGYPDLAGRICNRVISDISISLRETPFTISYSIDRVSDK